MQQTGGSTVSDQTESEDITFSCQHCTSRFIVDAAAAGRTLICQECGKPTTVPDPNIEVAAGNAIRISELQRHLKENESQRTEITSYINQLHIQLHRWELRLQSLKERQQKLEGELTDICSKSARPVKATEEGGPGEPTLSEAPSSD